MNKKATFGYQDYKHIRRHHFSAKSLARCIENWAV